MSSQNDQKSNDFSAIEMAFSKADASVARYRRLQGWCFLAIAATLVLTRVILPLAVIGIRLWRKK